MNDINHPVSLRYQLLNSFAESGQGVLSTIKLMGQNEVLVLKEFP
jgi:hypothetical protein